MDATTTFAANLRRLRIDAGLSRTALAKRASISTGYLGELERGEKSPTLRIVAALADALPVEPAEFVRKSV